jgi:hypothetical protein
MVSRMGIETRIAALDWSGIEHHLDDRGYALTPPLLTPAECGALILLYDDNRRFRSRVDMARYRFGVGEYKYFAAPLPPLVGAIRLHAYRRLAPIANRWMEAVGDVERFPPTLAAFLAHCARQGQKRPTPLLLRYEPGGYNCLHQDLYGAVAFPIQLTFGLSRPGIDYTGGESLLVEQRPRAQSRGEVIVLPQGAALVFPTRYRPIRGSRGWYRATVRHGVSRLHTGKRLTLGVIFHDAA